MAFSPGLGSGSGNASFGFRRHNRMFRDKPKPWERWKPFGDITGPKGGKGGSGSFGKSSLGKSTVKKGKALMESINPLKRTELYKKQKKPVQLAIDAAWMSGITAAFNNLPMNPISLESPFGLPFGPTYPTWKGWPDKHFKKNRRRRRKF